jgi:hypothetical protein
MPARANAFIEFAMRDSASFAPISDSFREDFAVDGADRKNNHLIS